MARWRSSRPRIRAALSLGALFAVAAGLVACPLVAGLSGSYSAAGADAAVDGTVGRKDAALDAPVADAAIDACPVTCAVKAAAGWTLVAWSDQAGGTCPAGSQTQHVVEVITPGSCGCPDPDGGAVVRQDPSCDQGNVSWKTNHDGGTTCTLDLQAPYAANDGGCVSGALDLYPYIALTPPPPTGGVCKADPVTVPAVTRSEVVCAPPKGCPNQVCAAGPDGGSSACLYQAGDVDCPSGAPKKHSVASAVATNCSCSCAIDLSNESCVGVLNVYASGSGCASGNLKVQLAVDGGCEPMNLVSPGDPYEYSGTLVVKGAPRFELSPSGGDMASGGGTVCCP
jgi:hypothetical protein